MRVRSFYYDVRDFDAIDEVVNQSLLEVERDLGQPLAVQHYMDFGGIVVSVTYKPTPEDTRTGEEKGRDLCEAFGLM